MYKQYWDLECRPFENTADPNFYYPSECHQATLMKLRYTIENRRGAALVVGGSGLGKTMLVSTLDSQLPEQCGSLIHLKFPQMPREQLLTFLANEISGEKSDQLSVDASVKRIERKLCENIERDRHTVVVIDEAHLLRETGALETIRLLLNFEEAWTLILSGQPALLPALERMPELDERLGVKCLLRRFTLDETISYVNHRLQVSGAQGTIFEPDALETIHHLAEGIARRVNRLCDLSLLIGFAEEYTTIRGHHVEAVADELITATPALRKVA